MKNQKSAHLMMMATAVFLTGLSQAWSAQTITAIDFKATQNPHQIEVKANGELQYDVQENAEDKQVVLEISNAKLANDNLARKLDTSSFNSNILLISPYQVEGEDKVRIVFQLREMKPIQFSMVDGAIQGTTEGQASDGAMAGTSIDDTTSVGMSGSDGGLDAPPGGSAPVANLSTEGLAQSGSSVAPDSGEQSGANLISISKSDDDILGSFLNSQRTRTYVGKPITLQLRDAEVSDVFRLIGEASGFNIILGDDVRGRITLALTDVPWDLALDTVFQTLRLGGRRNGNVLRVATLTTLAIESQEVARAKQAEELAAPRITKVFPINYADPATLQPILAAFVAAQAAAMAAGAGGGGAPGVAGAPPGSLVQIDARTNSLVVQDTPDRMDQIKKLIEILDTQTPQVMIEAKVVEATEGFARTLNGNIGVGDPTNGRFYGSFAGANPLDPLLTVGATTGAISAGDIVSATGSNPFTGQIGLSPNVGFLPGIGRLNTVLTLGESENSVRVVSSPRTVVLNRQSATITQSQPVLLPPVVTVSNGVATTSFEQADATISLTATPTVTNEGSVLLVISIARDVPLQLGPGSGVASRNMNTTVLVDSGNTLVIGGIYTSSNSFNASGFPILRKIPIIGALFGGEGEQTDRSELYFFITPRILNAKEAGVGA